MSITLTDVRSGYNLAGINDNFEKIESELNNNVLRRDGLSLGEDNQMNDVLDMNGYEILNATVGGENLNTLTVYVKEQADRAADEADMSEASAIASEQSNQESTQSAAESATSAAEALASEQEALVQANRAEDEADRALAISDELDDGIRNAKEFDPSQGAYPAPVRMEVPYVWFANNSGTVGAIQWAVGEQLHYVPSAVNPETTLGSYYRVGGELAAGGTPQPINILDDIILLDTKGIAWNIGPGDKRDGVRHDNDTFTFGNVNSALEFRASNPDTVTIEGKVLLNEDTGVEKTSDTGAAIIPVGTEVQRPTGAAGHLRFNSDNSSFEGYDGTEWGNIGGGGVPPFLYVNSDFTIEQRKAYSVDCSSVGQTVATIPLGLSEKEWFAVSAYNDNLRDGSYNTDYGTIKVALTAGDNFEDPEVTSYIIDGNTNAAYYFQKVNGVWKCVDGIGESTESNANSLRLDVLEPKVDALEEYKSDTVSIHKTLDSIGLTDADFLGLSKEDAVALIVNNLENGGALNVYAGIDLNINLHSALGLTEQYTAFSLEKIYDSTSAILSYHSFDIVPKKYISRYVESSSTPVSDWVSLTS